MSASKCATEERLIQAAGTQSWFVAAYRAEAEKLQRGDPNPGFPLGCFPPALLFVDG